MTLQTVPPLSLTEIYTEFGAPLGTPLSEFVRGGAWVPDTAENAGVPTTVPISILDLLGASAQTSDFTNVMTAGENNMTASIKGWSDNANYGAMNPENLDGNLFERFTNDDASDTLFVECFAAPASVDDWTSVTVVGPGVNGTIFASTFTNFDSDAAGVGQWRFVQAGFSFTIGGEYTLDWDLP